MLRQGVRRMPVVVGIDPGTFESAFVIYDATEETVLSHDHVDNEKLLELMRKICREDKITHIAIEMISSYGMPVGKTTFDTIIWIGRLIEIVEDLNGFRETPLSWRLCYRKQITKVVSAGGTAKDGNIRQALLDRFPATGGGADPQVGTKKDPGPLYGVSKHKWQALAVAVYASESTGIWNKIPPTTKG